MKALQNILVVNVDAVLFDKVAPVLRRTNFDVDRFPDAGRALELVGLVPFNAIIVSYPMSDVTLDDFLTEVRGGSSAGASVAVLVAEAHRPDVEALEERGIDLVLALEKAPEEMQRLLCSLLKVAPRSAMRVLVKLELVVSDANSKDQFVAQSEDISATGMLVGTHRTYPVGARARFEMFLPDDENPLVGEAEVARHTDERQDRVQGMGFRFASFEDDSKERLLSYLKRVVV